MESVSRITGILDPSKRERTKGDAEIILTEVFSARPTCRSGSRCKLKAKAESAATPSGPNQEITGEPP